MPRKETLVQLTDELLARLDEEAARKGVSRSAVLREAVTRYFASADEVDRAIVEAYTRVPPGTPDAWGDIEVEGDRAGAELLARLDEEERRAKTRGKRR